MSTTEARSIQHRDDHHVQFYNNNDFIAEAVAEFLEPGFRNSQPMMLVSTPEHRDEVYRFLRSRNCDVLTARTSGTLCWLDARETLAKFMREGMPDPELFTDCIGRVLDRVRVGREHLSIRAFGEMVDLLLRDGNPEGAVQLEALWNQLGPEYGFSLLCAYSVGNLFREEHWKYFQMVCDHHVKLSDETMQGIHNDRLHTKLR